MWISVSGFDWDDGNSQKCAKHGVRRSEIEEVFEDVIAIAPDERHSTDKERRYLAVGRAASGRYVLVVFTQRSSRGAALIRPISARYMHKKEVAHYEKESRTQEVSDLQE